jgi:hypothetical protein
VWLLAQFGEPNAILINLRSMYEALVDLDASCSRLPLNLRSPDRERSVRN